MANSASYYIDTNGDGVVNVNGYGVIRFKVSYGGYNPGQRAQITRDRLNTIFGESTRDFDFITPGWLGSDYGVISAHVHRGGGTVTFAHYTSINEDLYDTAFSSICTVSAADASAYGMTAAALALNWARNIRSDLQSADLNCIGEAVKSNRQLVVPSSSYSGSSNVIATYYGAGEQLQYPTTSNGEVFHTCDLTIASGLSTLSNNTWVKVSYNGKNVISRVNDTAPSGTIDLTNGGVAKALNCYGRYTVTISTPS